MRRVDETLDIPQSAGAGDAKLVETYVEKWVEVDGTFTGTCEVQGRLSPSSAWVTVNTATGGTPALIEVKPLFHDLRVDTTNVATGAPVAKLAALDARTS